MEVTHTEITYDSKSYILYHWKDDFMGKRIARERGFLELNVLNYIQRQNPDGVYIDCGANIGNHSVFFNRVMGKNVLAVEAMSQNYQILLKNVGNEQRITALNAVLDKEVRVVHMELNEQNMGMCKVVETTDTLATSYVTSTVDELSLGWENIGLLKIDVEFYEMNVIKGARGVIQKHRPDILVETIEFEELMEMEELDGYELDRRIHTECVKNWYLKYKG